MSDESRGRLARAFAARFGAEPTTYASAPGRVNLMGEHTDYNGGLVLPTPLPQATHAALARRAGAHVRAASAQAEGAVATYSLGHEAPGRGWLDYVQGLTWALRRAGHALSGFDLWLDSDVPLGAGLASSAALAVSVLRALRAAFGLALDDVRLALLAHEAESRFVGARVGTMDQMVASLGEPGSALFLDTRDLYYERVPLPLTMELVVIDSGVAHAHAAGDYNTRRAECERACALLGVGQLRELGEDDLDRVRTLPEPFGRRARHVVTENARVRAAVVALRAGDATRLGALFYASHASQRDDYAVSVPETDLLVDLARADPAVYGARLTGGGFGGAVVLLVRAGQARAVAERVTAAYVHRTGRPARTLVPEA